MDEQFYILECPYCEHKMGTEATIDKVAIWREYGIKIQCSHCKNGFPMVSPHLYKGSKSEVLNQGSF